MLHRSRLVLSIYPMSHRHQTIFEFHCNLNSDHLLTKETLSVIFIICCNLSPCVRVVLHIQVHIKDIVFEQALSADGFVELDIVSRSCIPGWLYAWAGIRIQVALCQGTLHPVSLVLGSL